MPILLGARYYDPGFGRFLNRDPIGYDGGQNLYNAFGGNPINGADPSGCYDFTVGGFQFTNDVVGSGLAVGLAATGSSLSLGAYNGGKYRNDSSFATSKALADIGRDAAITAATMGAGNALAAAKVAKNGVDIATRAKEIHGALDTIAQTRRTTAVVEAVDTSTGQTYRIVSSSTKYLSKAQQLMLKEGEIYARGEGHAEETAINKAVSLGLKITKVAASRPICPTCTQAIRAAGAIAASPLK